MSSEYLKKVFCSYFTVLFLLVASPDTVSAFPILDIELVRLKSLVNGITTIVRYVDLPKSLHETYVLSCKVPTADRFEWKAETQLGSPYPSPMKVKMYIDFDRKKPWERVLVNEKRVSDLMLIWCDVYDGSDLMLKFLWIVLKMMSNIDKPFHPVICQHPKAKCHYTQLNCYFSDGVDYRGNFSRHSSGECQYWDSTVPNGRAGNEDRLYLDKYGRHKNCRNTIVKSRKTRRRPWCIMAKKVQGEKMAYCNVPRCFTCNFGDGAGNYPGYRKGDVAWPTYNAVDYVITKNVKFNSAGKKRHLTCYPGTNQHMESANQCKLKPEVYGREDTPNPKYPYCFLKVARQENVILTGDADNPRLSPQNFIWARCAVRQCLVRQVWVMFLDPAKNEVIHDENTEAAVKINVLEGQPVSIKFIHFGTTIINKETMWLSASSRLEHALSGFNLEAYDTLQTSFIKIKKPTKKMDGVYTLNYRFMEGLSTMEQLDFKFNLEIKINQPHRIFFDPIIYCPGFEISVRLRVQGKLELSPDSITWYYGSIPAKNKDDGEKLWFEVLSNNMAFKIANDGTFIKLKKLDEFENQRLFLKVNFRTLKHDLSDEQEVQIKAKPKLRIVKQNVEGVKRDSTTLSVQYENGAEAKWIFMGKILAKGNGDKRGPYTFDKHEADNGLIQEDMLIDVLLDSHQGIYTVQVVLNGCKTIKTIYLSVRNHEL